jgi:hypothetical protein
MASLNFRDLAKEISPSWFRIGIALRLLYVFGLHFDLLIEKVVTALELRFPMLLNGSSLPYLNRERRIRQGLGETNAAYGARLEGWLDSHLDRGGPYPMLEQIYAHYRYATPFRVHLIYTSGARFILQTDGTIERDAASFTTGLGADEWAHWWLVYEWPEDVEGEGTWGDPGTWGDGGVWGSTLLETDITDIRLIPTEWNAGHCGGTIVLLSPGQALWGAPAELWGAVGTWGDGTDGVSAEIGID